jgi:uncharacterized protein
MFVKIHDAYRKIVAVCDSDIIGKTFTEGIRQIEVRTNFYKGEEKNNSEVIKIMKDLNQEDATFNLVGEKTVELALEAGVISEHGIIKIEGVPVALGLF